MEYRLGEIEMQFADIIWENEPVKSGELVRLAREKFDWKKSTTYTILKRICERGLFVNNNGIVESKVSKDVFLSKQTEKFLDETFDGSLPKFMAAFVAQNKLSEKEIAEIQEILDKHGKG